MTRQCDCCKYQFFPFLLVKDHISFFVYYFVLVIHSYFLFLRKMAYLNGKKASKGRIQEFLMKNDDVQLFDPATSIEKHKSNGKATIPKSSLAGQLMEDDAPDSSLYLPSVEDFYNARSDGFLHTRQNERLHYDPTNFRTIMIPERDNSIGNRPRLDENRQTQMLASLNKYGQNIL